MIFSLCLMGGERFVQQLESLRVIFPTEHIYFCLTVCEVMHSISARRKKTGYNKSL